MFHIGQHVVCVKEPRPEVVEKVAPFLEGPPVLTKLNKVYTIRGVYYNQRGRLLCYLEEIVNPRSRRTKIEPGFPVHSFRPLKKLSLEDFTTTKEPVTA